jgi:uncharacterized protein (DUF4415 family)
MKKSKISSSGTSNLVLTDRQRREIERLKGMPDEKIDTSDIPELGPKFWKNAVVGKFYRPVKKPVTIRLDADVIAWLKADGRGYQTKVNRLLRESMLADITSNRRKTGSR